MLLRSGKECNDVDQAVVGIDINESSCEYAVNTGIEADTTDRVVGEESVQADSFS